MDIDRVRQETEVTAHYAYFDTGAAAPPPRPVIDTVKSYLEATARSGPYLPSLRKEIYAKVEEIRQQVADFLSAEVTEIAFTRNGSEAISIIAQGIDWQQGDEVIVPNTEMLSNLAPWLRLAEKRGIVVVSAKANAEGVIDVETIEQLITPRTRLLTFCSLSNATGAIQPAQALCDLAKKHGVLSLVSASQSVGIIETNVKTLGCDFLATCGRKGLRAIEGSGILYVRHELIRTLEPCLVGWWNSAFDATTEVLSLPETAKRFEAGCPNIPAILSLGAAIEYAEMLGMKNIEARVRQLTAYMVNGIQQVPNAEVYGPKEIVERIGLVPFNIKGIDPNALVSMLEKEGVIIEAGHFMASAIMRHYQIERMARLSLHYFNTTSEIDKTIQLIRDFCAKSA